MESLRLPTRIPMLRHMLLGSAMWLLGAMQFFGKRFRQGQLAWVHRFSGRLFLLTWVFGVGPTAMYLSLFVGTGEQNAQLIMSLFAVMSMDVTLFAYYFFWRALLVIRRKAHGHESVALHGQAMTAGFIWTMTILIQRPLQLVAIIFRYFLVSIASLLPQSALRDTLEFLSFAVLDHHVVLSLTTAVLGFLQLLAIDGPRTKWLQMILGFPAGSAHELFGSSVPGFLEKCFWRCRIPLLFAARAVVTGCFVADPNPMSAA